MSANSLHRLELEIINNFVEAHCYGVSMAGQFLSKHVAVKQVEGKTFRPRRSSSFTILEMFLLEIALLDEL